MGRSPFLRKCDWNRLVQASIAFKTYLEEVKSQLAEMKITKPKNNLSCKEHEALTELKQNKDINLKKADKGSTTVVMNKTDKIREGQIQIDDKQNCKSNLKWFTETRRSGIHTLQSQEDVVASKSILGFAHI